MEVAGFVGWLVEGRGFPGWMVEGGGFEVDVEVFGSVVEGGGMIVEAVGVDADVGRGRGRVLIDEEGFWVAFFGVEAEAFSSSESSSQPISSTGERVVAVRGEGVSQVQ